MWHIYTMEDYSAIKRNEIELFVVRWMDLKSVIQNEVSQKEKNSAVKSSYLSTSYHLSWERVWNGLYRLAIQNGEISFCFCNLLMDCLHKWMCITFWFNARSVNKTVFFSSIFVEKFSGLAGAFVFPMSFFSYTPNFLYWIISTFVIFKIS